MEEDAKDHPDKENFKALEDWIKEGGGEFSKVKLRY